MPFYFHTFSLFILWKNSRTREECHIVAKELSHKGKFLFTVYILQFILNMYYVIPITRVLLLQSRYTNFLSCDTTKIYNAMKVGEAAPE